MPSSPCDVRTRISLVSLTRLANRVDGILHDIHEDLLDLDAVGMDRQPLRCQIETQRDPLVLHLTRQPAGRIADHLAEVRRFEPRLAP